MELFTNSSFAYINNLDTNKFAKMLDDPTQCYKFYWLDAILALMITTDEDLSFDSIFDEMICAAWHSVTKYHLRLGPVIQGVSVNLLELAVTIVGADSELPQPSSRRDILEAIKRNAPELRNIKEKLARNVPYRLLSPFMDDVGGNDRLWDQKRRLIAYIDSINQKTVLLYTIIDGPGIKKKIHISTAWRRLIIDNYTVIRSWVQMKKVRFLQDRNPGVPGIVYKLGLDEERNRKLNNARNLWKRFSDISGDSLSDIYTGEALELSGFDLDHFVPWSYIANDELWNLTPIDGRINSIKSNKLPSWMPYFSRFADSQFNLYKSIFLNEELRNCFEKCRRDNLNAIWATEELYIEGNNEEKFKNILEHYLRPVYESARIQGYDVWKYVSADE